MAGSICYDRFRVGKFFPQTTRARTAQPDRGRRSQFLIAIYGGYFGGGIGFLMLAALTIAGLQVRAAGATKNVLAAVMNASAVVIFLLAKKSSG